MIVDFRLPHLGDGINSADVIKVNVKIGDKVSVDQVVVEIETDKATVEVPSDVAGIVKEIFVKEGSKAKVGEPLISVEVSEQSSENSGQLSVAGDQSFEEKNESEPPLQTNQQKITEKPPTKSPITDHRSSKGVYEFKIPELGENITSAQVSKVIVKTGDKVFADQIILEIETDKATVEVPTEIGGIVKEVNVKDGDKVSVGTIALLIENGEWRIENEKKIDSAKITSDITLQTEKDNSFQLAIHNSQFSIPKDHTHLPQAVVVPRNINKVVVPAAPSVRRFAREIGIEISNITGTGNHERISIEDIKAYAKKLNQQLQKGEVIGGVAFPKETLPDFSKWGEVEHQPMSNIRRKTAEHLSFAWATIPHVTQFDKADITELENLRKQFGKKVEEAGGKLTVTGILLKVIASAMKVFPQFNSSVDMERSEVIYKKYINIGIAVDTDRGLLVPVIRDVDKKNITELSVELNEISKKARDKKLSLEEMQGGCFTISNLGGIGGTYFTPIVNSPEVAILGVSRAEFEQVYINGDFKPRLMLPLSLSYDHRIIDGADGIRFLRWVINALENPFLLSLEG